MKQVDIDGREYLIEEDGRIHKRKGKGFLSVFKDKDGYIKVTVRFSRTHTYNEALHRIVYRAFVGEIPVGMTVDHIDGDKDNNHWKNLQLMTSKENAVKGNARCWKVLSPTGELFDVYNLESFCRERSLRSAHMKSHSYKGWKVV